MNDLKKCPFCGRAPQLNFLEDYGDYYVSCRSRTCVEQKHCYRSKSAAIKAWNRRAKE